MTPKPPEFGECLLCGGLFEKFRLSQMFCRDKDCNRARNTAYVNIAYHADSEKFLKRAKEWREANPERFKQIQLKAYRRECVQCGKVRRVMKLRVGYTGLCRECFLAKVAEQAKPQPIECFNCSRMWTPQVNSPSRKAAWQRRMYCPDCRSNKLSGEDSVASLQDVADVLGITRERVRQLQIKWQAQGLTIREARERLLQGERAPAKAGGRPRMY